MTGKLLRRNVSVAQTIGYGAANLMGLVIIACALMFYLDVRSTLTAEDSFLSSDHLILSRHVSSTGSGDSEFSEVELAELRAQPWVRSVGEFRAADFGVQASLDFGGQGMSSSLFLESVPDQYLDIEPRLWRWASPTDPVPVIISKDYLTLYNFGFASSRGLPRISQALMGNIPLSLTISGNGEAVQMPARVVGFSTRLNTIAVPQAFMDWASGEFGSGERHQPSRIIVDINSPGDPAVNAYISSRDYEYAGDKADRGRASYFLKLVTGIITAVGSVITILAFFILMLSLFLLMQKSRHDMHNLMQLGYSPGAVSRPYISLLLWLNVGLGVGAIAIAWCAQAWWMPQLADADIDATGHLWAAVAAVTALTALLTAIDIAAIRRLVRRAFR